MTELLPLAKLTESAGSDALSPLWAGQAAPLGQRKPAADLTRGLAQQTLALLGVTPE
jgi:nitronate monooxygenase